MSQDNSGICSKSHIQTAGVLLEPMSRALLQSLWHELATIESVNLRQFTAFLNQTSDLIRGLSDLAKQFRLPFGCMWNEQSDVLTNTDSLKGIREGANHLLARNSGRRNDATIRPREQDEIKRRSVPTIESADLLTDTRKNLTAMTAPGGVSSQRKPLFTTAEINAWFGGREALGTGSCTRAESAVSPVLASMGDQFVTG
jgi:hypothetical protein